MSTRAIIVNIPTITLVHCNIPVKLGVTSPTRTANVSHKVKRGTSTTNTLRRTNTFCVLHHVHITYVCTYLYIICVHLVHFLTVFFSQIVDRSKFHSVHILVMVSAESLKRLSLA